MHSTLPPNAIRLRSERLPSRLQAAHTWLLALGLLYAMLGNASAQDGSTQGQVVGGMVSEHPAWFKESFLDIAEDVADADAKGKHVMLFLYLNGCPYCYKMVEENIKHAPYTDFIKDNFDVIALNIRGDREVAFDEHTSVTEKALADKLKVTYTPTVVFLNSDNKVVARVNGYRSVADFKYVLDYVKQRAYQDMTLASYIDQHKTGNYKLRDYPQFVNTNDLHNTGDKPLAVIFEDKSCVDCDALYDGHLSDPEVQAVLSKFTVVRLDALSDEPLTAVDGSSTTPKRYAETLGITYRPGIVLFDKGREIARIESLLYRYHFTELLRYVGERHYVEYPDSFYDYLDVRTAELLAQGKDVNVGEQK